MLTHGVVLCSWHLLSACQLFLDVEELADGQCPGDQKACHASDGAPYCAPRDEPELGCGRAACVPCFLVNAESRCDENGDCARRECHDGYDDCGGGPDCETDVRHDPLHCGRCGEVCKIDLEANGVARCDDGVCRIRCTEDHDDCDGNTKNGCEIDLATDSSHCGACGAPCAEGFWCNEGRCVSQQDAGIDSGAPEAAR